jgi:SAM-dependent methyltransferase
MRRLMDAIMRWRARGLVGRIAPWLRPGDALLDVGSGTGHNGERLRRACHVQVTETDVVDFSTVGPKPVLFDGRQLPFADVQFDAVTLIYVLHYVEDPVAFLKEARRVCRSRIVLVQTTCDGFAGLGLHWCNEWISRLGFQAARFFGLIDPVPCPVRYRRSFSRDAVLQAAQQAGLRPASLRYERLLRLLPLSRLTCTLATGEPGHR